MAEQSMRERAIEAGMNVSAIGPYGDIVRRIVDAVLAEIETPTEGMLNAARDWSYAKYGKPIGNDAAIGCLAAMIRAAREGK